MQDLIKRYYSCFNQGDYAGMLAMLDDEVLHEPSQGQARRGKGKFREFLAHMERCYKEQVHDPVIMVSEDGRHAAAEFMLSGSYLQTDDGLPQASGQTYRLRVGAFFEIDGGLITRVSNHYNLQLWLAQVGA